MAAQDGSRTGGQGSGDKIMAVPHPFQRHKQLAGLHAPRIVTCSQKGNLGILGVHGTTAPLGRLGQCDSAHIASNLSSSVIGGQPRGDLLPFIQMALYAIHFLIRLMSLARQNNHISRPAVIQCKANG